MMKIREIIARIEAYHPSLGQTYNGCDAYKCGDPEAECTGVVTAMAATVNIIRQAAALGANLIVVHEPTNHTSADEPGWPLDFRNDVFAEKERMLKENGIVIWRDHDHMHAHHPDGIFTGVLKYLGWQEYAEEDASMGRFTHFIVTLPQAATLQDLLVHLKKTIGLNGLRYIGPKDMPVRRIAIVGHLYPAEEDSGKEYSVEIIRYFEEQGVDVILPGETIDWTLLSYARDAVQLGRHKAVVTLGHFNWEELGMRYAQDWLSDLLGEEVPVYYLPSEDMYSYLI